MPYQTRGAIEAVMLLQIINVYGLCRGTYSVQIQHLRQYT